MVDVPDALFDTGGMEHLRSSAVDCDVLIIGAGVTGAAVAWELSKYQLNVVVLEKENDVALGASRANSGLIHAGFDPPTGSIMARTNVLGSHLASWICADLDVPYKRNGALVLAYRDGDFAHLQLLLERGQANGVHALHLLSKEETRSREPLLGDDVLGSLLAESAALINPWAYTLALLENAVTNGVQVFTNKEVTAIERSTVSVDGYTVYAGDAVFSTRYVINAAGVHADEICRLVNADTYTITPTRGAYDLLDKAAGYDVRHTLFRVPDEFGKGVLVSPTIHGHLLVGPDAEVVQDKEDTAVEMERIRFVRERAASMVAGLNPATNVRNYAGLRAVSDRDDFIIEFSQPHFLEVAGIKSPGLSAAPAIALWVAELLEKDGLTFEPDLDWQGTRQQVRFHELPSEVKRQLVAQNPAYGNVVCRCETITEGEIRDACRRPLPPVSVDGVKRRANTGLGRCQGGFCGGRVLEILAEELGVDRATIPLDKTGSCMLAGRTKEAP